MNGEQCGHRKEWMSGNIFISATTLDKAGEFTEGDAHNFDRVTATLPDGSQVVREFMAPDHILIKAEVLHRIEALEDNTIYWCVYSHRDAQGEVVQTSTGFGPAYY